MLKKNEYARTGHTELICSIVVLVFGILGLAKLADRFDRNISQNAIAENEGQQAPNKSSTNAGVRAV